MTPSAEIAHEFVRAINGHDINRIVALLTDDHCFVDSLDNRVVGREDMATGWAGYFAMVPDYWITVEQTLVHDSTVALFGRAGGSCVVDGRSRGKWSVPAAWRAVISGGRVSWWQVYADNDPIRSLLAGTESGV